MHRSIFQKKKLNIKIYIKIKKGRFIGHNNINKIYLIWIPDTKKAEKIKNIIFNKKDEYIILNIPNTLLINLNNIKEIGDNKPELDNNN